MSLGTRFQSGTEKGRQSKRKKKAISTGLLFTGIVLVIVVASWVGLGLFQKKLNNEKAIIADEIASAKSKINTAITQEESDFIARASVLESDLYLDYTSNDILQEIEKIMVLKQINNSGDRVVLKSFQYNAGANTNKTFKGGKATITGAGSITITADADTFDVMAQQIEAFKKSSYFDKVKVGTTDRDDFGRIVFTLTMNVNKYDKSPYENNDIAKTENYDVEFVEKNIEDGQDESEMVADIDSAVGTPVAQPTEVESGEELN